MHISKRSNGIYYLWFTDELGRKKKISTGSSSKSDALKFFRSFTTPTRDRLQRHLSPVSLSRFAAIYLDYARSRYSRSYCENIGTSLSGLQKVLGDLPLHDIGVREVEKYVATMSSAKSDRTSRAYFVTLASAFQTAVRWEHTETNPFRKVKRPQLRELVPVHMTTEAFRRVLACENDPDLHDLYLCAISTGMRLGELTALQWDDVDFARRQILVRNTDKFTTKSGRNRTIPMNARLVDLMEKRRHGGSNSLVFYYRGRALTQDIASRHFKDCVLRAKVNPSIHFHSLRHTFATWLVQAGVSIYEVQRLLGHRSIAVTQVYAHLAPSELHGTVEKLIPSLDCRQSSPDCQIPIDAVAKANIA